MMQTLRVIILTFLVAISKDLWPSFRKWCESETGRLVVVFITLLALMFITLFWLNSCALFTNNLSECRKACGPKMVLTYSDIDGVCVCKDVFYE